MGSADCEPISELCRYAALSKAVNFGLSFPPELGPILLDKEQTHNAARAEYGRSAAQRI
jgi:hypothetical protein